MKVNILTAGFRSTNGIGFLYPILFNKQRLKYDYNIDVNVYTNRTNKNLFNCDILICDSKYYKPFWKKNKELIFSDFIKYKKFINKVIFFDIGDSSGFLLTEILPFVDKYLKSFVYKNKNLYTEELYGDRLWCDYYFKNFNIIDNVPIKSKPVENLELLKKIEVGYNQSLGNYALHSRFIIGNWKNELLRKFLKLSYPSERDFKKPSLNRSTNISCRIGLNYKRNTVSFQREKIHIILSKYLKTNKLNREEYFKELSNSKIVISPFGWGELNTPRDYEVALNGALLLKPDISHLQTWPNYFTHIETFKWDFSDLEEKIDVILNNYDEYIQKAIRYQEEYKHFITTEEGYNKFCNYFKGLLL